MSFRSYMREHAPHFEVLEAVTCFEQPHYAGETMRDLLRRHPDLAGVYVAGGGLEGILESLREHRSVSSVVAIAREFTDLTRHALIDGTLSMTLSHPLGGMAEAVVAALVRATSSGANTFMRTIMNFDIQVHESL